MRRAIILAGALLAGAATAACNDRSQWEKDRQADMAQWWEDHDRKMADMRAESEASSTRWAIEQNTQALQSLNTKLRRR